MIPIPVLACFWSTVAVADASVVARKLLSFCSGVFAAVGVHSVLASSVRFMFVSLR